jgi:hypothetical protein
MEDAAAISASETTMPLGYWPVSISHSHGKAGFGSGGGDQLDNYLIADEGLGAPVLAGKGGCARARKQVRS